MGEDRRNPAAMFRDWRASEKRASSCGAEIAEHRCPGKPLPPCHFGNKIGAYDQHSEHLSMRNCRMSMWNTIVSGGRATAALRGVLRRWCLGGEWTVRHASGC